METDIYLSNAQKIIIESGKNSVTIDGKTYRLVEEKPEKPERPERPQKNPKIYTPKEVMEHLINGGWVESRNYAHASYYMYMNKQGYFAQGFKYDDYESWTQDESCDYPIGLEKWKLKEGKYFLIKPLTSKELCSFGRQGVDV